MATGRDRTTRHAANRMALRRSWIAARLNGVRAQDVPAWTRARGLPSTSATSFERAVGQVRASSPLKGQRGRRGQRRAKELPQIREWLLVDEPALDIRKVLLRLPNNGLPQQELLHDLRGIVGVRQVLEAGSDRELIVVALVRSQEEADDLRSRLEELAPGRPVKMDVVSWEDWSAAPATWLRVADEGHSRAV